MTDTGRFPEVHGGLFHRRSRSAQSEGGGERGGLVWYGTIGGGGCGG